jgi:hypothetical protein
MIASTAVPASAADAPQDRSGNQATLPLLGARETLDREEREIKDNVLRLGSLVADQIALALA